MNIGEDDLYMQKVMTHDNVSVILSPRATLREKTWGGMRWWMGQLRYYGSAFPFYPQQVKNYIQWELGSRALFFITAAWRGCGDARSSSKDRGAGPAGDPAF